MVLMGNYFRDYIDKVKATKKLAREKNVPVWHIPLANSIGMLILTAVYMSVYTWIAIVDMENSFDYIPSWWNTFIGIANYLPLIYLGVLSFTVLDKVLIVYILLLPESVSTDVILFTTITLFLSKFQFLNFNLQFLNTTYKLPF